MSHSVRRGVIAACTILALIVTAVAAGLRNADGDESKEPSAFIRYVPNGEDAGRLETAITTYRNSAGVEVALIAAVHIADQKYYATLQKEFEKYDALLYELIAPRGTRPQRGRKGTSWISMLQRGLKRGLGLEFQLDSVDYSPKNFVHADMDPGQFFAAQEARGESMLTIIVRGYIEAFKREFQGRGSKMNGQSMMQAMAQPDARRAMKLLFAQEMQNIEGMLAGLGGPDGESAILTERNRFCIKVLEEQLALGKKRLAIFYGGAHMIDMEKRVRALGFKKTKQEYVVAWNIPKPAPVKPDAPKEESAKNGGQ